MKITITNVYPGSDGESHFRDIEFPLTEADNRVFESEEIKARSIRFRARRGREDMDWHPAPRRQLVVMLKGRFEIEVGDGTVRRFGPGDMFLAEDTTGHGHIARAFDSLFLRLPLD